MVEEKILTLHPQGKTGRKISKEKYDMMKKAFLEVLRENKLSHSELFAQIEKRLKNKFQGNIDWYAETVKLDLEARKIIERTADKPQKYQIK